MPRRCPLVSSLHPLLCVFGRLTREEECTRILSVCGHDQYERVFQALDVQFKLLHDRAQLTLGISGVLVSTSIVLMTGKIVVRTIADQQKIISPLVVAAGCAAILSAAIVVGSVLRVQWMTQIPGSDLRAWIMASLEYRDRKTLGYRISIVILLVSMALFQAAALVAWVG